MLKISALILSASIMLHACTSAPTPSGEQDASRDTLARALALASEIGAIQGFSVSLVDSSGSIYENGFGHADRERQQAYTSRTAQPIASISKTLIAIALLKAQELGALDLKDPINAHLPFAVIDPHHPHEPILIEHLAYHSSSIVDPDEVYARSYVLTREPRPDEAVLGYFNPVESTIDLRTFLENSLTANGKWYDKSIFSSARPGETREYSNIAAALAALVIEQATGQDYRSFTRSHILEPLAMHGSGWSTAELDTNQRSHLFAKAGHPFAEYALLTYADGGFITSSHDLGHLLSELIKGHMGAGKLLRAESYRQLFAEKRFMEEDGTRTYGLFLEYRDGFLEVDEELVGHNGSDPGVFSAMYFNPKSGTGKIILVNTDTDHDERAWPEIEAIWKALSTAERTIGK